LRVRDRPRSPTLQCVQTVVQHRGPWSPRVGCLGDFKRRVGWGGWSAVGWWGVAWGRTSSGAAIQARRPLRRMLAARAPSRVMGGCNCGCAAADGGGGGLLGDLLAGGASAHGAPARAADTPAAVWAPRRSKVSTSKQASCRTDLGHAWKRHGSGTPSTLALPRASASPGGAGACARKGQGARRTRTASSPNFTKSTATMKLPRRGLYSRAHTASGGDSWGARAALPVAVLLLLLLFLPEGEGAKSDSAVPSLTLQSFAASPAGSSLASSGDESSGSSPIMVRRWATGLGTAQ
jgi:hypothetical protein